MGEFKEIPFFGYFTGYFGWFSRYLGEAALNSCDEAEFIFKILDNESFLKIVIITCTFKFISCIFKFYLFV